MISLKSVVFVCLFLISKAFVNVQESAVETKLRILTQEVDKLKVTVATLQKQVDSQNASQNESVAFLAYLSEPITNLQSNQHVVFDKVITNIGNAYNKSSGHFIAPIDGVYVFFVMLSNIAGNSVTVIVLRNGLWIGKVAAYGSITDNGILVTSTSAVPVELQYGDEVWVQNEYTYLAHEEVAGYKQSSFSGHLITSF